MSLDSSTNKLLNDFQQKKELALSERTYLCECGNRIDRDVNAAVNILEEGKRIYKKCA